MKYYRCPYCQEELRGGYDEYCPYCGVLIDLSRYQTFNERISLLYEEAKTAIANQKWRIAIRNLLSILSDDPGNLKVKKLLAEARQKEKLERFYIQGHLYFYNQHWAKALNYYRKIKLIQPGYRDVDSKFDLIQENLTKAEKEKPRRILITIRTILLLIGLITIAMIAIGFIIYTTYFRGVDIPELLPFTLNIINNPLLC